MKSPEKFVAQILESGAGGFAGLTASLLLETNPEIAERYEPDGFTCWKSQLHRWLLDLSAAVEAGEPALFEARMLWAKQSFSARNVPSQDIEAALKALRVTLLERLPEGPAETATPLLDRALRVVSDPRAGTAGDTELDDKPGREALSYLESILAGNPREAIDRVLGSAEGGRSVKDAYLDVLIPALRETGRMWHCGELSIAEEHLITSTTLRVMSVLCERARPRDSKGKTVLLACVAGNVHEIGLRAISDFFEIAGWRTINLGTDVPEEEIATSVGFFDADILVLAAALDPHLKTVRRVIEHVRSLEDQDVKIIVGGSTFEKVPDLWRNVGADGYSPSVEDVEPLGTRLVR